MYQFSPDSIGPNVDPCVAPSAIFRVSASLVQMVGDKHR